MKSIRLGVVFFLCWHSTGLAQQKWPTLQEAIAEADRLDPGWKLVDLIAKQPKIADDQNGAAVVAGIYKDLAKVWRIPERKVKRPPDLPEPTTLDELWLDIRAFLKQPRAQLHRTVSWPPERATGQVCTARSEGSNTGQI